MFVGKEFELDLVEIHSKKNGPVKSSNKEDLDGLMIDKSLATSRLRIE